MYNITHMSLLKGEKRHFLRVLSRLSHCNPFVPDRIGYEQEALGEAYVPSGTVWSIRADMSSGNPNVGKLAVKTKAVAESLRKRLVGGARPTTEERDLYEDLVLYLLYSSYDERIYDAVVKGGTTKIGFYSSFLRDAQYFLEAPGIKCPTTAELAHIFACFFQVRRAFHHIFNYIVGGSLPAARLRAAVWQSIFTHDTRRYRRSLYTRMGDVTTLITGPSGTGKELVARAIGLSQYSAFDPEKKTFPRDTDEVFHALNLSALSPTLIESELFGHCKGAFTGALQDRAGWLEVCPHRGTVFLDEIGELDAAIQVKLLRVLESREFQRLGETRTREFKGKVIAATNRDPAAEMRENRFREDLYYRLCSDLVTTPSLKEQIADSPGELRNLVLFIAQRIVGEEEAEAVASEVEAWIERELGSDYLWPGNVRELEQCVRNVLIRKMYRPPEQKRARSGAELADALESGALTAEEVLRRYATLVYAKTGSYVETARRLGIDRRTVKAKVDASLLATEEG
jgi:transcriptional regulator with AAA-type ATPase domain